MRRAVRLPAAFLAATVLLSAASFADPITKDKIPGPLLPWIDWVLHGREEARCPFFLANADRRECLWPGRLDLDLGDRGGRFTQDWLLHREEWVPLPGDARVWPRDVRVDGRAAVVTARDAGAAVRLGPGRHAVTGAFGWDAPPPVLAVPKATGLVRLRLSGRAVPFPERDEEGRLWLQRPGEIATGESRLDLTVHRSVDDSVPLLLTTRVEMRVSGRGREVVLGKALPDGFVPMSLKSPLPARLDGDGRVRAQIRPGTWTIEIVARHHGPVEALAPPEPDGPWDQEEIWVFIARPHLRLVAVEGAPEIDPQQTTLPDDLKRHPAYLVRPGTTLRLVEKRRGDSDPAPDQLALQRTLWLDFDGRGFTARDRLTGTMRRGWRLDMPAPGVLGRVAIDGQDQFITRRGTDAPAGVEIRQGRVAIDADSRVEGGARRLPAVGWDADFNRVSGTLNLPPGWRLLHAAGVDRAAHTWISSWTLLDFFLVLILTLALAKLAGWRAGLLALAALAAIWTEPGAPRWTWVAVLPGIALVRVLPDGRARRGLRIYVVLALSVLALRAVPFLILQVRGALYPALEATAAVHPAGGFAGIRGDVPMSPAAFDEAVDVVGGVAADAEGKELAQGEQAEREKVSPRRRMAALGSSYDLKSLGYLNAPDPGSVVQTGPGVPDWSWRAVGLEWRGPVERAQTLRLFLLPPALNRLLAFLRVGLVAGLGLVLVALSGLDPSGLLAGRLRLARLLGLVVAAGLAVAMTLSRPALADIPGNDLLETLRQRLLAPPGCLPACASSPRLHLQAEPSLLRLRLEAHAAAAVAVPLPGGAGEWLPAQVVLDGAPAAGLLRDEAGRLHLPLTPGIHQILMEGPLPERDEVAIALPLRPRQVIAAARGWSVEGLQEDGQAADTLRLVRAAGRAAAPGVEARPLPPFVRVERDLNLGLRWLARTRVVRATPPGTPILIEVPLLPGESVTTPEIRVRDGRAQIALAPHVSEAAWDGVLAEAEAIALRAPGAIDRTEVWRVAVGPIWHLEADGPPVVHAPEPGPVRVREWRPWPGETVTLSITRPGGLAGQTLTLDRSLLLLAPGLRATDATLDLTLRSSRGGQHPVRLPPQSDLQAVRINGEVQPIRQEQGQVTLPVSPGTTEAQVIWRQPGGIRALFRAPEVDAGVPGVNATVRIAMPADRWTLFLRGPRLGPAVLFWSTLTVAFLASLALGRIPLTPLRWRHWFLLGIGLTQVPVPVAFGIAAWILLLGLRPTIAPRLGGVAHDLLQLALAGLTVFALAGLFAAIQKGLLGHPEMQIAGNDSTASMLQWYQDRTGGPLPRPAALSAPLWAYRLAMLLWALWLAQALLGWLRWGWRCFTEGGAWRPLRRRAAAPPPVPGAPG